MFSIANSAAIKASEIAKTLPPPPPPKKKKERRQSFSSAGSNGSRSKKRKDKPHWPKQPSTFEAYGVKPILKNNGCVLGSERTTTTASSSTDEEEEISVLSECRKPEPRKELSVSFSNVEIREYIVQLGDSPYSDGPPICLSNEKQDQCVIDAIQFDEMRIPDRRSYLGCRLSASERSRLLVSMGYSLRDVADASVETDKNRRNLVQSLQNKQWDSFNAIKEIANRKMKKLLL